MGYINFIKKSFVLTVAALSISIVATSHSRAEDAPSGSLLAQIAKNTYDTVQALQNTPGYVNGMLKYVTSWLAEDTGDASILTKTQGFFANIGNIFTTGTQTNVKNGMQQKLFADMIGANVEDFAGKEPRIGKQMHQSVSMTDLNNDAYSTLLGAPLIQGQKVDPYAYIKNASGLNLPHPFPQKVWQGNGDDIAKYANYFKTITAIQSYNNYVISQLGTNSTATPIQNQLIAEVSKSEWLAQIASEELGKVLRQILLFESQNYVLNTQIQQNQQQLVATQAMTNSLLILFNQAMEYGLLKNAQGLSPM